MILAIDTSRIINWIFAVLILIAAIYYFYLTFIKYDRKKNRRLIEFVVLLGVSLLLVIPPLGSLFSNFGDNISSPVYLGILALMLYVIVRLVELFR
jgi:uncharacterized membrane protein YfcA